MRNRGIWIVFSVLIVLGLLAGVFGCATTSTPTPTPTSTPTPTQTPTPTSTPTPKPTPTSTPSPSPTQPAKITLRFQDLYFPGAPYSHWPYSGPAQATIHTKKFFADISDGLINIEILPPGAVVPVADTMKSVGKGIIDGAVVNYPGYYTKDVPEADIEAGLPFAWLTPQNHWDAMNYYGLRDEFQKIYTEEHNIHMFPWIMNDIYHFGTTFPVNTPDAIKGKKIRATGVYGEYVKALGGSPTVIAAGDLYMALKLGTIDGTIYGLSGLEDLKLKEVWKYYVIDPNTNSIGGSSIINLDKWKTLPERVRYLADTYLSKVTQASVMEYWEQEQHMIAAAKKGYGFTPVAWSEEDKAKVFKIGIGLWDTVAAKSERCARLVNIVKKQARDLGKIE